MANRKRGSDEIRDMDIIDMILIDHRFAKEAIEVFKDENASKDEKLAYARNFLDAVHKHSVAEQEIVYSQLEPAEEFHFNILEAQIEHGIVEDKIRSLKQRVSRLKTLSDEVEAELKVLAELVEHHIKEEESELLPKMSQEIDAITLKEMGQAFMELRKMGAKELRDYPHLEDELISWKDSVQKISSQFLSKMDKYVENLKH